jgi:prophage regulatory protein
MTTNIEKIQSKQKPPRKRVTYISAELPKEGSVRLPSVLKFVGISKNAYIAGEKAGIYPKGRLLTPRVKVYLVSELRAFMASIEKGDAA